MVTNAAGSVNLALRPGDLMAIADHVNLSGWNPLAGPNDDRLGPRFPDMSTAYRPELLALLLSTAASAGIDLRRGVYAGLAGPSYETPAEIRMLRVLGADAVGMSTVPEVIVAAHMGVGVAGISCITNLAAGIGHKPLSHEEVAQTANQVKDVFQRLLSRFLPRPRDSLRAHDDPLPFRHPRQARLQSGRPPRIAAHPDAAPHPRPRGGGLVEEYDGDLSVGGAQVHGRHPPASSSRSGSASRGGTGTSASAPSCSGSATSPRARATTCASWIST